MKAGTKFNIEIGSTKIVDHPNGKGQMSITEYSINDGEKKEVKIMPSIYATDDNIMNIIAKACVE